MRRRLHLGSIGTAVIALTLAAGCSAPSEDVGASDGAFTGSAAQSPASAVDGVPATFQKDRLVEDSFYAAQDWASADEIQHFLEKTVWNRASWLATETMILVGDDPDSDPIPISEAIVRTAKAHGINPVLLLARMQVEKSLVAPSSAPSESAQAFGLGCHKVTADHPNGLDPSVAALNIQLECGAQTLATQLQRARDGQNGFVIDRDATTQDGVRVHPENAATSALYSYTPIEGTKAKNGNWLAWNITFRFATAIQKARSGS